MPADPDEHFGTVAAQLDAAFGYVAAQVPLSAGVQLDTDGRPHLGALEALAVPASLTELRAVTQAMLPPGGSSRAVVGGPRLDWVPRRVHPHLPKRGLDGGD